MDLSVRSLMVELNMLEWGGGGGGVCGNWLERIVAVFVCSVD